MLVLLVLGFILIALSVLVEHLLEVRECLKELRVFFQFTSDETA
jgi:hypothetical protein